MHLSRCICALKSRVQPTGVLRTVSTSARLLEASSQAAQPQVIEEKYDFEDLKVVERAERRKAKIPPFMKDVFLSIYNRDILSYPEILNKDESTDLDNRVRTLEDILSNPDLSETDKDRALKQTRIYGAPVNLTLNGFALITTERLRYLETLSANVEIAKRISDHWVAVDALKIGLPEEEFKKIAPDLIYGDSPIALCTNEQIATRLTQGDLRTTAVLHADNTWYITGEKLCRSENGYILVLARVDEQRFKVLLVHPGAKGVTYRNQYVTFMDTPAMAVDQAREMHLNIAMTRLDTCVLSYSLIKRLIFKVENYVRGKFVSGNPLADLPLVRTKMAEAMLTSYTAESMAYLTAGLLDGYEEPDAHLEIAMCRAWITERSVECALRLLRIPGLEALNEEWSEHVQQLRDLQVKDETQDTLNLFIALSGLQYAGVSLATEVKKMRNPLFHPNFIFKKMFNDRRQEKDDPKMDLYLEEYLHPSLKPHAQKLEYCVVRMRFAVEQLLAQHGSDIHLQHTQLERLAVAATEILAMTAVLGRASRSYCIGLRNNEIDMRLAAVAAELGRKRVQQLVLDIENGEYLNLDNARLEFGRKMLDTRTLLVESPTARTFW